MGSKANRPKKLKAFKKVMLSTNMAKKSQLTINKDDLNFYDVETDAFVFEDASYGGYISKHMADTRK